MNNIQHLLKPPTHQIIEKPRRSGKWDKPKFISPPKFTNNILSPAQKIGLRYEKQVGKVLQSIADQLGWKLIDHRWISAGHILAQPDFILISPSGAGILFEVKYTYTDTTNQRSFYTNLLMGLNIFSITSCTIARNLTPETPDNKIIHNINDLVQDSIWLLRI